MKSKLLNLLCALMLVFSMQGGLLDIITSSNFFSVSAMASSFVAKTIGIIAVLGAFTYWVHPDHSMPKLDQLNIVTFMSLDEIDQEYLDNTASNEKDVITVLKKKKGVIKISENYYDITSGIPESINQCKKPIFIYAGGYSNERKPYSFCVYTAMKVGLISGPCIVFDYATDTRRAFNFCQEQDLHCLNLVCQNLINKHSDANIILYGACKGATNKLRFIAENAANNISIKNIKAVIAESPPISVKDALKNIRNGGALSHWLCRFVMPNYSSKLKTIMHATAFSEIPVLIGSLPDDTISALSDINDMIKYLRSKNENSQIEHFVCGEEDSQIKHGQIGKSKAWRNTVNDFLSNHGLNIESKGFVEKNKA